MLEISLADGKMEVEELKKVESLFKSLDFDPKSIVWILHDYKTAKYEPVSVYKEDSDTSFKIPSKDDLINKKTRLNETEIESKFNETKHVHKLLSSIFTEENEKEFELEDSIINNLDKLDQDHQKLFMILIEKEKWERREIISHCNKLNLMVDGALEIINELSYEILDEPMIEGDEYITVHIQLAKEIINAEN